MGDSALAVPSLHSTHGGGGTRLYSEPLR